MSSSRKPEAADEPASKRAADFNKALLNMPGYADDSVFFMMRYFANAQNVLRECDFDELKLRAHELNMCLIKCSKDGESDPEATARSEEAAELRAKALEVIEGFPELVQDFDKAMTAVVAASRRGIDMKP